MFYVVMYLMAIILANLTVAEFGPNVVIINAFLFIGLDLTARDKLHEKWHNNHLKTKMFLLITSGSFLSWLINQNTGQIAVASMISFFAAAVVDTIAYHLLFGKSRIVKMNGSNVPSALTDSIVFPTIAFGQLLPMIIIGQFIAKVAGGFFWSVIISYVFERKNQIVNTNKITE